MQRRASLRLLAFALAGSACAKKPTGPTREEVQQALQKEAEIMKAEGEKIDPALQVKNTFTIAGVDVQEQPQNKAEPFTGVIRFDVETKTKEWDGTVLSDKKQKSFKYVYDAKQKKWMMRL